MYTRRINMTRTFKANIAYVFTDFLLTGTAVMAMEEGEKGKE